MYTILVLLGKTHQGKRMTGESIKVVERVVREQATLVRQSKKLMR